MKGKPRPTAHKRPPPPTALELRVRARVPSPEAWAKAFGGTKSIGVPDGAVGVRCRLKHETDGALLVDIASVGEVWVPRSICTFDSALGLLHVAEWFARREGLL